ncbi:MAG: ATP-binding protein [Verrucomicrobia bacterium]|nr:ATP-binding protein [Verrucomicrobiota bacterium]
MSQPLWTEEIMSIASMEWLPTILDWARGQIQKTGAGSKDLHRYELALEEAIVNIIHYAYPLREGPVRITSRFHPNRDLEFVLCDEGNPFNPLLAIPDMQVETPISEMREGGMGILLMRKNVDEVFYERRSEGNVLTLRKKIP